MPRGALGLGLTFFLACVSATFFLQLRCQGKGRAFGPSSRWWALSVIGLTGVLSTGVAFALVTIGHQLPSAFASLGVVAPSGLWLGHIRQGTSERNSLYKAERDLGRMLAAAYNVGLYRLDLYTRPARAAQPQGQPAGPPWHP
jgi:hypothetical protein